MMREMVNSPLSCKPLDTAVYLETVTCLFIFILITSLSKHYHQLQVLIIDERQLVQSNAVRINPAAILQIV